MDLKCNQHILPVINYEVKVVIYPDGKDSLRGWTKQILANSIATFLQNLQACQVIPTAQESWMKQNLLYVACDKSKNAT
jgi:hypothetical protein